MRGRGLHVAVASAVLGIGALCMALAQGCLFDVHEVAAPDAAAEKDATSGSDDGPAFLEDAASDTSVDAGPNGCLHGMVRSSGVCIDATEVTSKDYYAFAADAASRLPSHPRCGWVTTWQPDNVGGAPANDERPIVQVDWCEAWEYCAAAGKRLCGALGGGALPPRDVGRPGRDEWYEACTGGDGRIYSYGSTFSDASCNTSSVASEDKREPVGTRATCVGGLPGLFDMSGNAAEWADSCDLVDGGTGFGDNCVYHPGCFVDYAPTPGDLSRCQSRDSTSRDTKRAFIGFRCCATPR